MLLHYTVCNNAIMLGAYCNIMKGKIMYVYKTCCMFASVHHVWSTLSYVFCYLHGSFTRLGLSELQLRKCPFRYD